MLFVFKHPYLHILLEICSGTSCFFLKGQPLYWLVSESLLRYILDGASNLVRGSLKTTRSPGLRRGCIFRVQNLRRAGRLHNLPKSATDGRLQHWSDKRLLVETQVLDRSIAYPGSTTETSSVQEYLKLYMIANRRLYKTTPMLRWLNMFFPRQ